MMSLHQLIISSQNIRSLGQDVMEVRKRCELRDFLAKANPQPTIILLQEHHFGFMDCMTKTQQLDFKGRLSLWNNATYST
jgi:hypothetical protein